MQILSAPHAGGIPVNYLVVGGGGAGGSSDGLLGCGGGGGGAGGFRCTVDASGGSPGTVESQLVVSGGVALTVTVGAGGVAGAGADSAVIRSQPAIGATQCYRWFNTVGQQTAF